jgi:hypothetical protein
MQRRRSSKLALYLVTALTFVGALAILGCPDDDGGGGGEGVLVTRALTRQNARPLAGEVFIFPEGVEDFDTALETRVGFLAGEAGREAAIGTFDGGVAVDAAATGVEYGSCIFRVGESSFPANHPLGPGNVVTINSCQLEITTLTSATIGGPPVAGIAVLILNGLRSLNTDVTVQVNENEDIFVNGQPFTSGSGGGTTD